MRAKPYKFELSTWQDGHAQRTNVKARLAHPKRGQDDVIAAVDFEHLDDETLYPEQVWVLEKYQRRGIATEMYRMAEDATGKSITSGALQTMQGSLFRLGRDVRKLLGSRG